MRISMKEPYAFFPVCSFPLFDSLLRTRGEVKDLSYLYLGNTFEYVRKEKIQVVNGELNLSFGTTKKLHEERYDEEKQSVRSYLADRLKDIYGVNIYYKSFKKYEDFKKYIKEQLGKGEPVICQFNLMYTPTKVQYLKKYGVHTLMILGEDSKSQVYDCMEAGVNPYFLLKEEDLKKCFDLNITTYGTEKVYILKKENDIYIEKNELLKKSVEEICGNSYGQIEILEQFIEDITTYMREKVDKAKFTIPDLWSLSLERQTAIRWLDSYVDSVEEIQVVSKIKKIEEGLKKAANLWVNIVFTFERNMYLKEWEYSDKLVQKLYAVKEQEISNYNLWKTLKEK